MESDPEKWRKDTYKSQFGVLRLKDVELCESCVGSSTLQSGYRMVDTASAYFNEGSGGRACVKKQSGDSPGREVFLIGKLWIQDSSFEKTKASAGAYIRRTGGRIIWICT